jgi:hypothetical protein
MPHTPNVDEREREMKFKNYMRRFGGRNQKKKSNVSVSGRRQIKYQWELMIVTCHSQFCSLCSSFCSLA